MNKSFFYLITVLVTCLFSGVFAEVKADCTIHYYHFLGTDEDDLTLTGDDVEFPFINWTRPDADEIIVIDDNTSERLYHLIGAIPRSIQYGDYSQPGTVKGPFLHYDVAPPLELNHPYIIEINENGSVGDRFGVEITGITCEEEEEGFVLENTGTGNVYVNGVLLPPCSQSLREPDRDVPITSGCSLTPLEPPVEIMQDEKSEITIDYKCFHSLVFLLTTEYWDQCIKEAKDLEDKITRAVCGNYALRNGVTFSVLFLNADPELCRQENSKPNAVGSSSHISLELQSGAGRFNSVLDNLSLDIETNTAKVSSLTQNDFAVGHSPDTHLTVAACYKGSVTVDPTNPTLSSVTLMKGQKVNVWSDRIGPITNIGQIMPGTNLLLLDDGAE